MWGGRFSAKPDQIMEAINASIGTDKRLAEQDIAGSKAHAATVLAKAGVISAADAKAIEGGLDQVAGQRSGTESSSFPRRWKTST